MNKVLRMFFLLFILAFILNLVWEIAHCNLYEHGKILNLSEKFAMALPASFGDAFYITLIYFITFILIRKNNLLWFSILSISIAAVVEYISVHLLGRWSYGPNMPIVFGIGFFPLIQLFVTGIISIIIISTFVKNKTRL